MIRGIFRNKKEQQHKRETQNIQKKDKTYKNISLPNFSYGAKELGLTEKDEKKALQNFVKRWFKNPEAFLNFEKIKTNKNPIVNKSKDKKEVCYSFQSFLDKTDKARFYESKQPFYGKGQKIAFIILPHWNAEFQKYKKGTTIIRKFFLPVATYRYFPAYSTEKEYVEKKRYDIIGPNIGLTIKRFRQDILNIQYFAKYLKKELKYEKIGIWTYSIGSPRGFLASIFSERLFDYLIMNPLADSFPDSLLHGIATQDISKELLKHLDEKELEFLLSPLSPGKYKKYFNKLPKFTRLVQGKYDLVFGEENNKKLIEKINGNKRIEIEYGNFGHTTCGELDKVIPTVKRNSKFVLKNSNLHFKFF